MRILCAPPFSPPEYLHCATSTQTDYRCDRCEFIVNMGSRISRSAPHAVPTREMQEQHRNEHGQPIGAPLPDFKPRPRPSQTKTLMGYGPEPGYRLEPLNFDKHFRTIAEDFWPTTPDEHWTYMPYYRPTSIEELKIWLQRIIDDTPFLCSYAIIDVKGKARGIISYLSIEPAHGAMEVGQVFFSTTLQRTTLATEVQYTIAKHAFDDLGYRRLVWKSDSLNARSTHAARRLGYKYEGLFRNQNVYKGRTRDTTWYSMTDYDWPRVKHGFEEWLKPENFDKEGIQKRTLEECRGEDIAA